MKINSQSKISTIIKHNAEAIEAIASLNPHFTKFRNPILRKVLAPRVTIEDAARIGKCNIADIMDKLSAVGFEIEDETLKNKNEGSCACVLNKETTTRINEGKINVLDVRPILNAGLDPFSNIMKELKRLPEDFVLEVINSFEPTPLIKILDKKGYSSYIETKESAVHTYFLRQVGLAKNVPAIKSVRKISLAEMEAKKEFFKNNMREIDVQYLEMPLPMVTILNELEDLPEKCALFVHHKKVPQYLLPELEERNFTIWIAEAGEGNVSLLIHQ